MRLVKALASFAEVLHRRIRSLRFWCVHAGQPQTYATAERKRVADNYATDVLNVGCSDTGVGRVEERNEQGNPPRPSAADHDAFSDSGMLSVNRVRMERDCKGRQDFPRRA
jgi:hypothetical protein